MAFTLNNKNLVFLGSMQYLSSSLDALVKNVSYNDFKHLSQEFSDEFLESLKQKGVYPYEYMDSFIKFSDDKLSDRYEFYITLEDECISKKDCLYAIDVWIMFKMNTMCDYYCFYLKTDVSLLADVLKILLIYV